MFSFTCQEVDLMVSSMTVTPNRWKVVDFTSTYFEESLGIFVVMPKGSQSSHALSFTDAAWRMWLVVFIAICVIGIILHAFHAVMGEANDSVTVCGWVLRTFGLFFQQGIDTRMYLISTRVVSIATLLVTMIFMAVYSGTLIATFTSRKSVPPFNSMEELIQDDTYTVVMSEGNVVHQVLQNSQNANTVLSRLYKRINHYGTDGEFMDKAKRGEMVARITGAGLMKFTFDGEA